MTANIPQDPLPFGLSEAGQGSASISSDGSSSLSSSIMNRSRTSTGDSSLSTDTNVSSSGSGAGIPPPSGHQPLSSSSSIVTNATNRRRSHRPRGCRGGRKNRKKNSQTSGNIDSNSGCSTNHTQPASAGVPTEIVGTSSIPLSPRDGNTQTTQNFGIINMFHNNSTHHQPSKATILNRHQQPHEAPAEKISVFGGAEINSRNTHQCGRDENTRQSIMMTTNTTMTTIVADNGGSLLPHPLQPNIAAAPNTNLISATNGQQDHQHQHQQIYPARHHTYPHPHAPNASTMRFVQHHPSHTFIAHPMSYDMGSSISENREDFHSEVDFQTHADNSGNNNNFRHQEPQQQQQPSHATMDLPFDPSSRSAGDMALKNVKQQQLQMLATTAASSNKDKMSIMMGGSILPPLPSTKREESPIHTGPNPYALTLALTTNVDRRSEDTTPITVATTTTASTTATTSMAAAQSSNAMSQLSVQTMNLHPHMANEHSDLKRNNHTNTNNNNNNNALSSSTTTRDGYRSERLEKQRQMLADGGSLFVISPRSFLTGVKVVGPTTTATPAATTTTVATAW
jgi:hypothetical protein